MKLSTRFSTLLWIAFFFAPLVQADSIAPPHDSLTPIRPNWLSTEEIQYLEQKDTIRLCVDPGWMPYERINNQGRHEGIAADYFAVLTRRTGIKLELYPTQSWSDSLKAMRERRCDVLSMAREMPERKAYMNFTRPYLTFPFVVATTNDKIFIEKIEQVLDQTFLAIRDFAVIDVLRHQHPGINIVEVDSAREGLDRVRRGQAFGYIDSTLSTGYAIQQEGLLDIKISAQLKFSSSPSIATRNDEPLLNSIFQKALDTLNPAEKDRIYNRWVSVRYEKGFDYSLLMEILLGAATLVLFMLYWNRRLAVANRVASSALSELKQVKDQLEQKNRQLENQNLQLECFANTDSLTGLYNRAKLDQILLDETQRCLANHQPISIALLDIDRFKAINDTWGHPTGDKVLIELGQILMAQMTDYCSIGRWGGEEFMLICPQMTLPQATDLAQSIRITISDYSFDEVSHITASIGVATLGLDDSIHNLVRRADSALYRAKENGRNRVEADCSGSYNVLKIAP